MKARLPGGDLEYAVLLALWDLRSASARQIYARVGEPDGLVYTTITKVLDRLCEKRLVIKDRIGNVCRYQARVRRADIERRRARELLRYLVASDPDIALGTLTHAIDLMDEKLLDELAKVLRRKSLWRRARPRYSSDAKSRKSR